MINDDMYRKLSSVFFDFANLNQKPSEIKKGFKTIYESLVEQTFTHFFNKQYRNLETTLLVINTSKITRSSKEEKVIKTLKASLCVDYPLGDKTYTDHDDEINDFILNYVIPFVLSLIDYENNESNINIKLKKMLEEILL